VDSLLLPSVDSGFLDRIPDLHAARVRWDDVIRRLMGGHRSALVEASNRLIDDFSDANWDRCSLVALEQASHELDDDLV
jgi:hypothetical protein